jgi:hypothetical protein
MLELKQKESEIVHLITESGKNIKEGEEISLFRSER